VFDVLPVVMLGSMGLAYAAIIAGASRRMRPSADDCAARIRPVLPGIDCGACGFTTCADYALAASERTASPALCTPGGPKTAYALGDILGVDAYVEEPRMAIVHCKGGSRESLHRSCYDGIEDCHAAVVIGNGSKICDDGCLGLGSCVQACSFGAIEITGDHVALVNPDVCIGCGACVAACPRNIIERIPRVHKIFLSCSNHDRGMKVKSYCSVGCTACEVCVKATLSGSISMHDNLPKLDYSRQENFVVAAHTCPSHCFVDQIKTRPKVNITVTCTGCGACVQHCPVGAIHGAQGQRYSIEKKACIGCGQCLGVCPVHAISLWGGLGYVEDSGRMSRIRR
jgi:Na+-translocating ferredoxin:NAD+ oxidoreductase subunit B